MCRTMSPMDDTLLLDLSSVAQLLHISRRSVERLVRAGRLPSRRIGRRRLIPAAAVRLLASRDTPRIAAEPEAQP